EEDLLQWKDMPKYLQFNPYVLTGYRPLTTFKGCCFSLFYWHNETVNIFTHGKFLNIFYFKYYLLTFTLLLMKLRQIPANNTLPILLGFWMIVSSFVDLSVLCLSPLDLTIAFFGEKHVFRAGADSSILPTCPGHLKSFVRILSAMFGNPKQLVQLVIVPDSPFTVNAYGTKDHP
ncbi:hypothetical protein ABN196_18035, partial [Proteus terrae]|uniref:hypothetical protein n=1 Tax=Proteus terrae TaxID=1574161 RepID=UPI0032DA7683